MGNLHCRIQMLCVLTVATLAIPAGVAHASLTSGLVGDWTLDEGQGSAVHDRAGLANSGFLSGNVSWVAGRFGDALSFDGLPGQVKVADSATLEPASTVSVAAWVRHSGSPGAFKYVMAKGATACIAAAYGLYTGANGGLEFYVSRNAGRVFADSADAGVNVWDGRWHLAVGTFDGTTVRLYVDGVAVGAGTVYPGGLQYIQPDSNDFFIGNYPGCEGREFTGTIDDVMVWNRALRASEAASLVTSPELLVSAGAGGGSSAGGGSAGGSGSGGGSGGGSGSGGPGGRPPAVSRLHFSVTGARTGPLASRRGRATLSVSYADSQRARTMLVLMRRATGIRRHGSCVARHNRRGRVCTRWVVVATATHSDRAGANRYRLTVLLAHLSAGVYRLEVTPRSPAGLGSAARAMAVLRTAGALDAVSPCCERLAARSR